MEIQFDKKVDLGSNSYVAFLPLYLDGRYQFVTNSTFHPEAIVHLGYNFFGATEEYKGSDELSGGLYGGIGVGVINNGFFLQLMYRIHKGKIYSRYYDLIGNITHTHISVSTGYRF